MALRVIFSLEPHQFVCAENLTLNVYSTKCVRFDMLFCGKCLKACTVPGAMHNNRTCTDQWPSRKDHFLEKECEGSHSQGEGELFGSPLKKGRQKGRKEITAHKTPCYRSCARVRAEEDESPSDFGLGGKGGVSTTQTPLFLLHCCLPASRVGSDPWFSFQRGMVAVPCMREEQTKEAQHLLWGSQTCIFSMRPVGC